MRPDPQHHEGGMRYSNDQVARISYAAYRQLCEERGGPAPCPWACQPPLERRWWADWAAGAARGWNSQRIHEEWRAELIAAGWRVGTPLDYSGKVHPGLSLWNELCPIFQLKFFVVEITTVAMFLYNDQCCSLEGRVTAPLSGITRQGMTRRALQAISCPYR